MKLIFKSAYILLGVGGMLSACSQEEFRPAPSGGGEPIVFRTSLPGVDTRAAILAKDGIDYFRISAFNPSDPDLTRDGKLKPHFADKLVEKKEGEEKMSSPECLWPDPGQEGNVVHFFAYHPALNEEASVEHNSTISGGEPQYDYKIRNFRVNSDIASQIDFVTAYTTGNMADHLFSGITLPFHHQLSRIELKAWSHNKSCDIEIAGVRIGGIGVECTFDFKPVEGGGNWVEEPGRGIVEYIFQEGDDSHDADKVVTLAQRAEATSVSTGAVSIMGRSGYAMLIPSNYNTEWDFSGDRRNLNNNTYISVLLRVTDATDTSGKNPKDPQRYPYHDLSQGANSKNIPIVYLAVDKADGSVIKRLYKKEGEEETYHTDKDCTSDPYKLPEGAEIKEFGWAALPITGNWEPGKAYTYTLNYTSGVGLHDPEVKEAATAPNAGDPIISDKVGITYEVKEWIDGGGDDFPVPGS